MISTLDTVRILELDAATLIIDPQRSFTNVESAVRQMKTAGVQVVRGVEWNR